MAANRRVTELLKEFYQEFFFDFQAELGDNMEFRSAGAMEGKFNNGTKIGIRSGGLFKSFHVTVRDGASIFTDSIYAPVHEYGATIKAKKAKKQGFSKYQMEAFFWAKYIKTKIEMWKILALSVRKRGAVKIKARPFFAPTINQLSRELDAKALVLLDEIIDELMK